MFDKIYIVINNRFEEKEKSMICDFKCPSCGDVINYDMDSHKLVCNTCGTSMPVRDYDYSYIGFKNVEYISDDFTGYSCPDCNARIIVSKYQATAKCAYCDTQMSTFGLGKEELCPEKIIPYELNYEDALGKLMTWWQSKPTMPKFDEAMVKKFKLKLEQIYVPVWLFDADIYTCLRSTVAPFETSKEAVSYGSSLREVLKGVHTKYRKVPWDGSSRIDDVKFHGIEPFDYSALEDFNPSYLSGQKAEKYSLSNVELMPQIVNRFQKFGIDNCKAYTEADYLAGPIVDYSIEHLDVVPLSVTYAMLPVWMCSYKYGGDWHQVFVNGQTGKVDGEVLFTGRILEKETANIGITSFLANLSCFTLMCICKNVWDNLGITGIIGFVTAYIVFVALATFWPIISHLQGVHFTTAIHINEEVQYRQGGKYDNKTKLLVNIVICVVAFLFAYMIGGGASFYKHMSLFELILGLVIALAIAILDVYVYYHKRKEFVKRREVVDYFQYVKIGGIVEEKTIIVG